MASHSGTSCIPSPIRRHRIPQTDQHLPVRAVAGGIPVETPDARGLGRQCIKERLEPAGLLDEDEAAVEGKTGGDRIIGGVGAG